MLENEKKEGKYSSTIYKIELMAIFLLLFLVISLFWGKYSISSPSITGFVSVDMKTQPVNIFVDKSKNFILTSERETPFNLTSFRLSGKVDGEGRVEVLLDNGLDQQLVVFSNIEQKREGKNRITAMAVENEKGLDPSSTNTEEVSWLIILPWEGYAADVPGELSADVLTSSGSFIRRCGETCYMWLPLDKDRAYKFIVRTDPGTTVTINEIAYTIE